MVNALVYTVCALCASVAAPCLTYYLVAGLAATVLGQ